MNTIKNKYLWMVLIALMPLLPLQAQHHSARKAKAKAATEQKAHTLSRIFAVNDYWQKHHKPNTYNRANKVLPKQFFVYLLSLVYLVYLSCRQ